MAYLSPEEVAVYLKVTRRTVYRYLTSHEFPNRKIIARSYRIPQEDIDHFLDRCTKQKGNP